MLTTDTEWDQLTDRQKLARLRNVELDRDNLRSYVRDLIWRTPAAAIAPTIPVQIHFTPAHVAAAAN